MDEQNVKGALNKITGKIKEVAGDLTNNEELKREGQLDQVKGSAQDTLGHAKDAGKGVADTAKKAVE